MTYLDNTLKGHNSIAKEVILAEAEKCSVDVATFRTWINQPDYLAEFDAAIGELNISRQDAWDACASLPERQQLFLQQILPIDVIRTRGPASQSFADIIMNLPGNREYIEVLRQKLAFEERTADMRDLDRLVFSAWQLFGDEPYFTVATEKQITSLLRARYGVDSASLSIYEVAKYLELELKDREKRKRAGEEERDNVLRLTDNMWHISYEGATGSFSDRPDSVLRHLARLLAKPNKRFRALDFYPPPSGEASLPHLGRDDSTDEDAIDDCEKRMKEIVKELKAAKADNDSEEAARLEKEFRDLADYVQSEKKARKGNHKKKCGTGSPEEKADQALRVGLKRLQDRFRTSKLSKLADHLHKFLDNSSCEWWYAPPPGTTWQISLSDPHTKNNGNR